MRISDWSSDVCSSDLNALARALRTRRERGGLRRDGMTRLFHISDLHFGLEDRAALGWFADCVRAERPDAVLITGDLTMRARSREFAAACDWIGALDVPVKIGRAHVELQSLMRSSYAVFCLKKKKKTQTA